MEIIKRPILSVKLKVPEPRRNYIVRKELFKKVDLIKNYKISIIKGGAGTGKTTLLTSFIKERKKINIKWVSLNESFNDTFIFWKYVIECLSEYLGDEKEQLKEAFDSNMQKDNLVIILMMFLNKLGSEDDISLVLDDFQSINNEVLIKSIDFFIENMPENMHLVLITREVPKIYLGTLTLEGKVMFIDEENLMFSEEEAKEFLLKTLQYKKKDKLQKLIDSSEGWVGGLQLMALASKDSSNIKLQNFKIGNAIIDDYISKEIFRYLSKEERNFLEKTSILRYFNKEICDKYIPEADFNTLIESIMEKNLFVINIDEKEGVYRYHAIFSQFLNERIKNSVEKNKMHKLAAEAYFACDDYEECLYHLFIIEDYEEIMKKLLLMPQTSLTLSYILKVPMEEIIKNPDFAYQYFFCYYAQVDVTKCKAIFRYIKENEGLENEFKSFKDLDIFFSSNWYLSDLNVLSIEQIKKLPFNKVTNAYLLIKEAYFLLAADENEEAMKYIKVAEEIYNESKNRYLGFFILSEKTQIYENIGELNKALKLYKIMQKYFENINRLVISYYIGITGVYMLRMELSKAKQSLDIASKYINKNDSNINLALNYNIAQYYYISGEVEKASQIIENFKSEKLLDNVFYQAKLLLYPIYREQNKEVEESFLKKYNNLNTKVCLIDMKLLYVEILVSRSKFSEALNVINEVIALVRKKQDKMKIIQADLLKIKVFLSSSNNEREIKNLFIEAVEYAASDEIVFPFFIKKVVVEKVLNQCKGSLLKCLSEKGLKFLKILNERVFNMKIRKDDYNLFDLTEREQQVLDEMCKGYTNKEIAEKLYISMATVKTHILNIYGKLEVNNRVAAINKYKQKKELN